jgi:hypothetical protein
MLVAWGVVWTYYDSFDGELFAARAVDYHDYLSVSRYFLDYINQTYSTEGNVIAMALSWLDRNECAVRACSISS